MRGSDQRGLGPPIRSAYPGFRGPGSARDMPPAGLFFLLNVIVCGDVLFLLVCLIDYLLVKVVSLLLLLFSLDSLGGTSTFTK